MGSNNRNRKLKRAEGKRRKEQAEYQRRRNALQPIVEAEVRKVHL